MRGFHRIYLLILTAIVVVSLVCLIFLGFNYYNTPIEERFFHDGHQSLKPSGFLGHGYGILGSLFMLVGVFSYLLRKRLRSMSRLGVLSHWLEFHIFLCTLGPIVVLFHTAFKFGGLVAVSFWSMVAVFLSGIVGRFIYLQIPRSIEGRELSLSEVKDMKADLGRIIRSEDGLDEASLDLITGSTRKKVGVIRRNVLAGYFSMLREDRSTLRKIRGLLKQSKLPKASSKKVLRLVRQELTLNRKIDRLLTMQRLFRYWHVAHLPFAFVMLIIMIIHVVVTVLFGYRWIF